MRSPGNAATHTLVKGHILLLDRTQHSSNSFGFGLLHKRRPQAMKSLSSKLLVYREPLNPTVWRIPNATYDSVIGESADMRERCVSFVVDERRCKSLFDAKRIVTKIAYLVFVAVPLNFPEKHPRIARVYILCIALGNFKPAIDNIFRNVAVSEKPPDKFPACGPQMGHDRAEMDFSLIDVFVNKSQKRPVKNPSGTRKDGFFSLSILRVFDLKRAENSAFSCD